MSIDHHFIDEYCLYHSGLLWVKHRVENGNKDAYVENPHRTGYHFRTITAGAICRNSHRQVFSINERINIPFLPACITRKHEGLNFCNRLGPHALKVIYGRKKRGVFLSGTCCGTLRSGTYGKPIAIPANSRSHPDRARSGCHHRSVCDLRRRPASLASLVQHTRISLPTCPHHHKPHDHNVGCREGWFFPAPCVEDSKGG